MLRTFLLAVTMLGGLLATPAMAEGYSFGISCVPLPIPTKDPEKNPVVETQVDLRAGNGTMEVSVIHKLFDGNLISRVAQYKDIVVVRSQPGLWQWAGYNKKHSKQIMVGNIGYKIDNKGGGGWIYQEILTDEHKKDTVVYQGVCTQRYLNGDGDSTDNSQTPKGESF